VLRGEESQHCTKVLRKKAGDEINATDGAGNLITARITATGKDFCEASIEKTIHFEAPVHGITVAVAPTKNTDRIEWLTEKLVEIGVSEIVPVACAHSERKVLKTERLKKIALSAMKQSLKFYLPRIKELTDFKDFIHQPGTSNRFIGYCETENTQHILLQSFTHSHTTVLIGPEGDFSPPEVEMAKKAGFVPVSLGASRLRTETAAMVAATMINAKFETQNV